MRPFLLRFGDIQIMFPLRVSTLPGSTPMCNMRFLAAILLIFVAALQTAAQATVKPNIVVIWGDDIGQSNVSAYTKGLMDTRHRISIASPARA
jgi:hypothetical protein